MFGEVPSPLSPFSASDDEFVPSSASQQAKQLAGPSSEPTTDSSLGPASTRAPPKEVPAPPLRPCGRRAAASASDKPAKTAKPGVAAVATPAATMPPAASQTTAGCAFKVPHITNDTPLEAEMDATNLARLDATRRALPSSVPFSRNSRKCNLLTPC